jgi:hypothetical protein
MVTWACGRQRIVVEGHGGGTLFTSWLVKKRVRGEGERAGMGDKI